MPLPMTVPTTMEAAAQVPRARLSSVGMSLSILLLLGGDDADQGAYGERYCGADQNPPGEGDRGEKLDREDGSQARDDAANGGGFAGAFGQDAEQEHAEQ